MFQLFTRNSASKYEKVSTKSLDVDTDDDSIAATSSRESLWGRFGIVAILSFSNLISALLVLSYNFGWQISVGKSPSIVYNTEFGPARQHIELQQLKFTGAPSLTYDGIVFIPHPSHKTYIGDPTPEIDEAWAELVWEGDFLITEEEAKAQWPSEYTEFWDQERGGYLIGLDVFRTLQCLNRLRQEFHPEYYNLSDIEENWLSRDHCIDQIRQHIMCTGDVTPTPSRYNPGLGRNFVDMEYPHTCRNFDRLHTWVRERTTGKLAVPPVFGSL